MFEFFQKIPQWLKLLFLFPLLFLNGILLAFLLDYLRPLIDFVIIANMIAFLLNLLVDGLEAQGIRKKIAIPAILILSFLVIIITAVFLLPEMLKQFTQLVENAPKWIQATGQHIKDLSNSGMADMLPIDFKSFATDLSTKLSATLQSLGTQTLSIVLGTFNNIFNSLIIIILTIFFLATGHSFWSGVFKWLPSPWNERIIKYSTATFKEYFVARILLAIISSLIRFLAFLVIGVPYGVFFAFAIGIISLVPFLAGIFIVISAVILGFHNITIAFLFFASAIVIDLVTDNVLAPKLMGDKIGLHPIWIFISIFLGAKLGGLLGVFLAVPVASVVKQIVTDLTLDRQETFRI